jgi:hypothetical protein
LGFLKEIVIDEEEFGMLNGRMESLQLCRKILVYLIGGVWSLSDVHFVKTLHSVILNFISEISFQDKF